MPCELLRRVQMLCSALTGVCLRSPRAVLSIGKAGLAAEQVAAEVCLQHANTRSPRAAGAQGLHGELVPWLEILQTICNKGSEQKQHAAPSSPLYNPPTPSHQSDVLQAHPGGSY